MSNKTLVSMCAIFIISILAIIGMVIWLTISNQWEEFFAVLKWGFC